MEPEVSKVKFIYFRSLQFSYFVMQFHYCTYCFNFIVIHSGQQPLYLELELQNNGIIDLEVLTIKAQSRSFEYKI